MKPLQHLVKLAMEAKCKKYPNTPLSFIPVSKYSDRKSNGLTKCIIDWLILNGHQAERISNTGRPIDRRQVVSDCLGRPRQIGSLEWVPGTGTNGSADISATINGKSVKIEVKIKNDKMSDAQMDYKQSIEQAGGIYIIAKSFDGFYTTYHDLLLPTASNK